MPFSRFSASGDCPRGVIFSMACVAGVVAFGIDVIRGDLPLVSDHATHLVADILIAFGVTGLFTVALIRWIFRERTRYEHNLEAMNRRLRTLAVTDALTGVFNHRYFEMKLTKEWARMRRLRHALSCVMIDIDNFKMINDTYGHAAGDIVLRRIATLLTREFREIDIVSRYGGEEFTIILLEKPNHLRGLAIVMERIRKKIASEHFQFSHHRIDVTVSLGGAMMPVQKFTQPEKLVAAADNAMYAAKKAGKNCARVWGGK